MNGYLTGSLPHQIPDVSIDIGTFGSGIVFDIGSEAISGIIRDTQYTVVVLTVYLEVIGIYRPGVIYNHIGCGTLFHLIRDRLHGVVHVSLSIAIDTVVNLNPLQSLLIRHLCIISGIRIVTFGQGIGRAGQQFLIEGSHSLTNHIIFGIRIGRRKNTVMLYVIIVDRVITCFHIDSYQ